MPNDIYLLTTVPTMAQRILDQGGIIIINWFPSHLSIKGNELADRLAEKGLPPNPMIIHPSRKVLRHRSNTTGQTTLLQLHREEARISLSTRWYSDGTGYDPLALSETINTGAEVILHKVILDYHCAWQVNKITDYAERTLLHTISKTGTTRHSRARKKIMALAYIAAAGAFVGNLAATVSIQRKLIN